MTGVQEPKRQQLVDELRARIAKGEFRPGDQIPSERDLAGRMGADGKPLASRDTVRRALADLRAEGLLVVAGGKRGTVVREVDPLVTLLSSMERGKRRDNPTLALDDWAASVVAAGRVPRQTVTVEPDAAASAAIIERPGRERVGLHIQPGERVVRRHRKRWVDDRPVQLVDSWFPWDVASTPLPGTDRTPLLEEGDVVLSGGILASIGHPQAHTTDDILAMIAPPEFLAEMDLPRRTVVPLLVGVRAGYDRLGRAVRLMVISGAGDRNVFRYETDL